MTKRGHIPGSVASRMLERINAAGQGTVFIIRDFLDLGSRRAVDENLRRLTAEGVLRRLGHGIYDYPRFSTFLNQFVPPAPEVVAAAVARRSGASILPVNARAANSLGISTQVPAKNVFRTNGGKARRVTVAGQEVELRPTTPGQFRDDEAGVVIAALRFLGEQNVNEDVIARLRSTVTPEQKEVLAREWRNAPGWM
ncbi:MAG: hypothetical protein EOP06_20660, partial [Proteobacteria bacterium]